MGYIDFVTNNRDANYFHLYHKQAFIAYRRIVQDHSQSIAGGAYLTLHYFILWMGNSHRAANILKVWALPEGYREEHSEEWANMIMTFLKCIII
jgi:hypothetical protein